MEIQDFSKHLEGLEAAVKRQLERDLPKKLGNIAVRLFKENFQREGHGAEPHPFELKAVEVDGAHPSPSTFTTLAMWSMSRVGISLRNIRAISVAVSIFIRIFAKTFELCLSGV